MEFIYNPSPVDTANGTAAVLAMGMDIAAEENQFGAPHSSYPSTFSAKSSAAAAAAPMESQMSEPIGDLSDSDGDFDDLLAIIITDIEESHAGPEGKSGEETGGDTLNGFSTSNGNRPHQTASSSSATEQQPQDGSSTTTHTMPSLLASSGARTSVPIVPENVGPPPCIEELREKLLKFDENKDGELTEDEFVKAIQELDVLTPKRAIEQIYRESIWTEEHEMHVDIFVKVATERGHPLGGDTPIELLRKAFPLIFHQNAPISTREVWGSASPADSGKSATSEEDPSKKNGGISLNAEQLHCIQDVLESLDDDEDGKIDFPEFDSALQDLGVDVDSDQMQFVFAHWVVDEAKSTKKIDLLREMSKQRKEQKALASIPSTIHENKADSRTSEDGINFTVSISPRVRGQQSMQLDFSADDLKKEDEKSNADDKGANKDDVDDEEDSMVTDEDEDDDGPGGLGPPPMLPKQMTINTAKRKAQVAELSLAYILDRCRDVCSIAGAPLPVDQILRRAMKPLDRQTGSPRKFHKQRRQSRVAFEQMKGMKAQQKSKDSKSDGDTSSILHRPGKMFESIEALRFTLTELNDDGSGRVDFEDFLDALTQLHTRMSKIQISKLFFNQASRRTKELRINAFIENVGTFYRQMPNGSCDDVLEYLGNARPILATVTSRASIFSDAPPPSLALKDAWSDGGPGGGTTSGSRSSQFGIGQAGGDPDYVLGQIQLAFDSIDQKGRGYFRFKQLEKLLKLYDLQDALERREIKLVFRVMCDEWRSNESGGASSSSSSRKKKGREDNGSIQMVLSTISMVLADHPAYGARRAVYRGMKRILKIGQATYGRSVK